MKKHIRWLGLICTLLAMLGCTVMQPVGISNGQLATALHPGDHVQVTTTSGQQLQFAIEAVDQQGLHGEGQNVSYSDIQSVSRKQTSTGRTTALVLGAVAAAVALAAGGGGGGGGGY